LSKVSSCLHLFAALASDAVETSSNMMVNVASNWWIQRAAATTSPCGDGPFQFVTIIFKKC
jgi:hypothetical protein